MRILLGLILLSGVPLAAAECSFRRDPDAFLEREARGQRDVHQRLLRFTRAAAPGALRAMATPASSLEPRNFIDEEIFAALAAKGVKSAPLSTDEEFLRRVTLDLTGRLPSPNDVRAFVASEDPEKRDKAIDKLIGSPEFVDKWTMWWGDLLENCNFPALFDRRDDARNAYYAYIKGAVATDRSLRDVVQELMTANGNTYDAATGATNFPITAKTSMGPNQDTADNGLVKAATYFLGMSQYDCILCHNGRGHLEDLNLWGTRATRVDAWRMAAHFSRLNMPGRNQPGNFYHFSFDVSDRTTGTYDLNTTTGNRPNRQPLASGVRNLTPAYRDGTEPAAGENWRAFFGKALYQDPMFATNFANRFWREFMGLGLVEPYDMLDPDRLDPENPPPAPWKLQATHPVLLQKLAREFAASDFNVRHLMRVILRSNAYQMSSRYDGEWTLEMVPLFARHYPRRLWSEEVHDILAVGSGVFVNYNITRMPAVRFAMQFPDTDEPRGDGGVAGFLNAFLRGNRDSRQRTSELTILQRLAIMNDNFVFNRTRATAPNLAALFRNTDNAQVVEEIFLMYLGRRPDAKEARAALASLGTGDRTAALEDLVWACVNRAEFLFSY